MKAYQTKTTTIHLELTAAEAAWLRAVMQNPLNGEIDPSTEDIESSKYRHSLFDALQVIELPHRTEGLVQFEIES